MIAERLCVVALEDSKCRQVMKKLRKRLSRLESDGSFPVFVMLLPCHPSIRDYDIDRDVEKGVEMAKVERESINFKLPKTLAAALRAKAVELNTTATDLVIQGLNHILGDVPGVSGSVEKRLYDLEEEFWHFKENIHKYDDGNGGSDSRLVALEDKLETVTARLAKFEGALIVMQNAINNSKSRKSGYSSYGYNSVPAKIEPHDEKRLARRLSTNVATLTERRQSLSEKEFEAWTRDRDGMKRGWRFNSKDGLYYEVSDS